MTFYPYNDQEFLLSGVTDLTGTLVAGATITATLTDPLGRAVLGFTNVPMTDVANQPGSYVGQLMGSTFNPPPGAAYTLLIDGTTANNVHFYFTIPSTTVSPLPAAVAVVASTLPAIVAGRALPAVTVRAVTVHGSSNQTSLSRS